MALSLEGILRYKSFSPNDPSQIFKFVSADHSAALQDVSLLINNNSGKSLDVPNGTLEPGARIVPSYNNYTIKTMHCINWIDIEIFRVTSANYRIVMIDV